METELTQHDGRRARRDRSREQAVDAVLELLDEGIARPTAQQVAMRSGVSLRSIFRIFDDVDSLHSEAALRQLDRNRHLYVQAPDAGPLTRRVKAVVELHDQLYSAVAPVRRAGMRASHTSDALADQLDENRTWLHEEINRVFAAELTGRNVRVTAAALELLLSFEAWDQLAATQGLDSTARKAVTTRAIIALLDSP